MLDLMSDVKWSPRAYAQPLPALSMALYCATATCHGLADTPLADEPNPAEQSEVAALAARPEADRTEGMMLVYDGGLLTGASIQLPPEELRSWAWCDTAMATKRLSPLLARRVSAARRARSENVTVYLEDGTLVA